ncbi:phosphoglucomutase (alpha-D-glucose-1,6-bisphosphate-dependent) [Streptomyces sp. NRRL B-24484]|uniref:phosphoglucomutase (alpha-D-glucose-1,6-bisphosphate-dependent) n=1 Tax=Streptomyces sp. NRRL B-24484 TaxID=1463833 RepID=UPI0004C21D06|nr:phosphoglucomutase (alpha-D-glucose-1,6-bisphosphate-dependent) [Streptomyces sp. NRRL B-24484]
MKHSRAGQPVLPGELIDVAALVTAYYTLRPDQRKAAQRVAFGQSGHRGSALDLSFNEDHVAAMTQAVCNYRAAHGITGPLFLGADTHALSEPARVTAIEVLAANGVSVLLDRVGCATPTPAVSHAILRHNRAHPAGPYADGIVLTPSLHPPRDGGFRYNLPHGGPAGSRTAAWLQDCANALISVGRAGVRRFSYTRAQKATERYDYLGSYVDDLPAVTDLDAVRGSGLRIGADPLGGASVAYWHRIAEVHRLDLTVVNPVTDPTWGFMALDRDGQIRTDCSSPYAMASLIDRKHEFGVATGNDAAADRHGIVTPDGGLMDPDHYLAVAVAYLYRNRTGWPSTAAVGKTLVSSSMIDRVAADLGRGVIEVPRGFTWFVGGLHSGAMAFGGEGSAGASFLRRDGSVWTTDKDGILLALLASEITAVTGRSPSELYTVLTKRFGMPACTRVDAPADRMRRTALANLSPTRVKADRVAGEKVTAVLARAPGNGAPIGGLKVCTENAWFVVSPSGTEDVCTIHAESFLGQAHVAQVQTEAQAVLDEALAAT